MKLEGTLLVAGSASGPALILPGALSFWGGVDPETGTIIDRTQPACGERLAGKVLVMPSGRGSSSASSVLAEVIRNGFGPAAIVLQRPDAIITAGAIVARSLYGLVCPVVTAEIGRIADGDIVTVSTRPDGSAEIEIGQGGASP
jgi:hypothetical protein